MKKRTISGAIYVAILLTFFLLRQFVNYKAFHLLTYFLIAMGTFELARAIRSLSINGTYYLAIIFGILFVPVYYLGEHVVYSGLGYLFAIYFIVFMLIVSCVLAIITNADLSKFAWTGLQFIYPALLLLCMLIINENIVEGLFILILGFVISPISDTFAYFVGSLFGGKKLCPKLSPKKTWSGAIGGTIGGILSSLVVYWIFMPTVDVSLPNLFFMIVGLVASIINIFGDLFESFIKRKMDIKDMGKIMPGHGGVLDRIDGTMFVMAFLYIVFLVVKIRI